MKNSSEVLNSKQSDKTGESSQSSDSSSKWSIFEKLAGKYDTQERDRVDKVKKEIEQDLGQYEAYYGTPSEKRKSLERERIDTPPSTLRKIGRLALDSLGIHSARSEKRRRGEAISIALNEHKKDYEDNEKYQQEQLQKRQRQEEEERQRQEKEEQRQKKEEQRQFEIQAPIKIREIKEELSRKRDKYNKEDITLEKEQLEELESFFNSCISFMEEVYQRTSLSELLAETRSLEKDLVQLKQELLENRLNSMLLTTSRLEEEVKNGNPEVEKTTEHYKGKEITVYTLKGFPINILSSVVGAIHDYGGEQPLNNVYPWGLTEQERKESSFWGGSDFISASLSSEKNFYGNTSGMKNDYNIDQLGLIYGFQRIRKHSLIKASTKDVGTSSMEEPKLLYCSMNIFDIVLSGKYFRDRAGGIPGYNETAFKRYDEDGNPLLPDYIITRNGMLNDRILSAAAHYDIPIINIDRTAYDSKEVAPIDKLNDDSSYGEIDKISKSARFLMEEYGDIEYRFKPVYDYAKQDVIQHLEKVDDHINEIEQSINAIDDELGQANNRVDNIKQEIVELREQIQTLENQKKEIESMRPQTGLERRKQIEQPILIREKIKKIEEGPTTLKEREYEAALTNLRRIEWKKRQMPIRLKLLKLEKLRLQKLLEMHESN